ncbi:hypothetical protein B0H12DRAFT_1244341 [Mycena haematopus]|nr:hypothetical protein B0H12DRAFT_1244341 [Mycena haematopus]
MHTAWDSSLPSPIDIPTGLPIHSTSGPTSRVNASVAECRGRLPGYEAERRDSSATLNTLDTPTAPDTRDNLPTRDAKPTALCAIDARDFRSPLATFDAPIARQYAACDSLPTLAAERSLALLFQRGALTDGAPASSLRTVVQDPPSSATHAVRLGGL